ncbi:hypothetical protein EV2_035038 [Malus domestica]
MKLIGSNTWRGNVISRVFGTLFNSTEALASASASVSASAPHPFVPLRRRILRSGNPRVSILPVLHQWLEEGRNVERSELQDFIKQLRKFRRYTQALQISEWMSDELNHDLHPGDIAIRLELISKVRGLEEAEKYFYSIRELLRVVQVCGALLSCYAEHNCLEKAEALFEKMKHSGIRGPLPYNTMLTLYSRMGKHGMVDILVKDMEKRGVDYNIHTLNIRLFSYAATSDINRMEKLLMKMEADPLVSVDWHGYVSAAEAFLKVGLLEKTSTLLWRAEQRINIKTRKIAYEYLMTSYAAIGNKDEVYRIWGLYKSIVGFYNNGYRCMLSSLMKMDDFDGAEKILEEWESGNQSFDIQIPNLLINAYCGKGLLDKAKSWANKLSDGGKEDCRTWSLLATGYRTNGQMAEAVESLKTAANMACQPGWKFHNLTLAACFEYLKEKGDVEVAHKILRLLRERGHLPTELCDRIENYIDGGDLAVLE